MLRKWTSGTLAIAIAAALALPSGAWNASRASAAEKSVVYDMPNGSFESPLAGTWDSAGVTETEHYLAMEPGSAVWQGIPVKNDGKGPSAGDVVYGEVEVTLSADADDNANVMLRINEGGPTLAEVNDLSAAARGEAVKLTTKTINAGGKIGEGKPVIYVELHNDTKGEIDVHRVKLWGVREDGTRVAYPVANADFAAPFTGASDWSSAGAVSLRSALVMQPGSAVWRSLPVGSGERQPHAGDKPTVSLRLMMHPDATRTSSVTARVNDGANTLLEISDLSAVKRGAWRTVSDELGPPVPDGAAQLWLELHNDNTAPIRVTDVQVTAMRDDRSYDLDGSGSVDAADLAFLQAKIKRGTLVAELDYDKDGQLTGKDASFFRKFALKDPAEVYANFDHFRFMNEKIAIDGIPMFISHLYAEPVDRSDLGKGYKWVGDPQEGVAALDDVARAVLVYVEHYKTYGDAYSYDMIKRGLSFAMWMQTPEGDFDNFVAEDAQGKLYKKDSHSSFTGFSFWAVRAYEAMAAALPVLEAKDAAFAAKVRTRAALCLDRVRQLVKPLYGTYNTVDGKKVPAWLLQNDNWLSAAAISVLAQHQEALPAGAQQNTSLALIRMLGEGLAMSQEGDFKTYPLSAFLHSDGTWYEWGSIQVKAMAIAGQLSGRSDWIQAAEQAADSFLSDLLISGRAYRLSPNKASYPQINYGTASYVENLLALYRFTGKTKYAEMAGIAAAWWTGDTRDGIAMFDQATGAAFDGVTDSGVNTNSGAESVDEALRAILRIKREPAAARLMTATKVESRGVRTLEAEQLYRQDAGDDKEIAAADLGLNDPARALRKQSNIPSTDEAAVYADATSSDAEAEIYPGWFGKRAIFVEATGHNNVRIYRDGYLYRDVPVGGADGFGPGDSVKLDFAAMLQFDTDLAAEVLAVDAQGQTTLLADDSAMTYASRTWYSGQSTVKTTPKAQIPEGTVKLRIRFSNRSTNPLPQEGYATVTLTKLYRMSVPEIRYGSPSLSQGSYVRMTAGASRSFDVEAPGAGEYDVFASVIQRAPGQAATLSASLNGSAPMKTTLAGTDGRIAILHLGSADLAQGTGTLVLQSVGADAELDAVYLYPVETYATYRALDGSLHTIVRDSRSRSLTAGTPAAVAARDRVAIASIEVEGASRIVRVEGTVKTADGKAASKADVRVTIGGIAQEERVRTDANGRFKAVLHLTKGWQAGLYRVEASTATGSGTGRIALAGDKKKG
ncbi:hypothetical protein [Cohnella sp. GbtcB17]|uniref:hypothetical protein n=1 Tax=Cohnella sp. GbtcB17 TaxID=2824762 RepID=UPI001C2FCC49|nr:hypothetical protein [Cohnella sp. GbtcB17]